MNYSKKKLYDDPSFGPKAKVANYEDVVAAVHARYGIGGAYIEGSTGAYRSIWVSREIVGTAWTNRKGEWYYRLPKLKGA